MLDCYQERFAESILNALYHLLMLQVTKSQLKNVLYLQTIITKTQKEILIGGMKWFTIYNYIRDMKP